jgi:hypothetical protein
MVKLVLEPGGGAGIRKARLKVSDYVSNGEGPATLVVGAVATNAVAPVAYGLLLYPELITAGKATLHFDGLAALAGETAERLQV